MSSSLDSTLQQAAISTFEDLGFLFAEPEVAESEVAESEEAARPVPPRVAVRSRVDFVGPMRGQVVVDLSADVMRALAENMTGMDVGDDAAICHDAVGELANVVCGNLLPALAGPRAVFDLGAPRVSEIPSPEEPSTPSASVRLGVEEGRAEVRLFLTSEGAEG
jgi:CheY-specific phosphatase CheX